MLSLIVFLPLLGALVLAAVPVADRAARWSWLGLTALELVLTGVVVAGYRTPPSGGLAYVEQVRWIPSVGSSYHVGVDGLSLPLVALTGVVFTACAAYAVRERRRPRQQAALYLFLQSTCAGVFVAQDLILFFVFFDLSIVGMYFAIAGWGHGQARRSALKFFLYTFLGSLSLLLGFIGVYLGARPHTFDIPQLAQAAPSHSPLVGGLVLGAILLGLAVKTPTVPFHTWLPPAHTDASAVGSAVLAGVMLKLGTYGFVRIAMPLLPAAWRWWAWVIIAVGIVSVLYGALVALAQGDVKRMIAYTSVNHMGYVVLGIGVAGLASSDADARRLAVTGAVTQMVSHGLITAALFLLAGVLHDRAGTYDMSRYGGLARPAPRFAALFAVGAFASLGLPAFSGFVAEFQVFAGSIGVTAVSVLALPGILVTAALFLGAVQRLLTGPTAGLSVGFIDLRVNEAVPAGVLLALALVLGLAPAPLLSMIDPGARTVVSQVSGGTP